jgi:hypothetical protein
MESGVQSIRASGGQLVNGGTCVSNRPGLPSGQRQDMELLVGNAMSIPVIGLVSGCALSMLK